MPPTPKTKQNKTKQIQVVKKSYLDMRHKRPYFKEVACRLHFNQHFAEQISPAGCIFTTFKCDGGG